MTLFASPVLYLVAAAWLLLVAITAHTSRRLPTWVMVAAATGAAVVHGVVAGAVSAGVSVGVGLLLFGLLAVSGAVQRTTTIALTPAMMALPLASWVAFVPGLVVAAIWSYRGLRRRLGDDYVNMLAGETLAAMGNRAGKPTRPDPSRFPLTARAAGADAVRVPLVAILAVSVLTVGVGAAMATLLS